MEGLETKEYYTFDKSEWGEGEWNDEPDRKQWQDPATGYACLILRSPISGSLCGYVGIPKNHQLYEVDFNDPCRVAYDFYKKEATTTLVGKRGILSLFVNEENPDLGIIFDVHGSLLFSGFCQETKEEDGICHIGEEKVWWFGFDCAHFNDIMPALEANGFRYGHIYKKFRNDYMKYRNISYVTSEVELLAQQLKKHEKETFVNMLKRLFQSTCNKRGRTAYCNGHKI